MSSIFNMYNFVQLLRENVHVSFVGNKENCKKI